MIALALLLGAVGLSLSAYFSGTETGFYRATRVRLVLDAQGGDRVSQWLLALTSRPALFVATALVGNNLANYVTSLSIVLATEALYGSASMWPEFLAPLVLAPVLFVYGELLPKSLYFEAPNRLLRRGAPLFLFFAALFAPLSAILWGFSKLLGMVLRESPEQMRVRLARIEIQNVLEEGHEAGLLHGAQRQLAQGLLALANTPVSEFVVPVARFPHARADMTPSEVLRLARRHRLAALPVEAADGPSHWIGYVRVIELRMRTSPELEPIHPLLALSASENYLAALQTLQHRGESLARVVDRSGRTVGLVSASSLTEPLVSGGG